MELYIHIPFCKQKCRYCDFPSYAGFLSMADRYLEAVEKEMAYYSNHFSGETVTSVFIGGGTPSVLTGPQLKKLLTDMQRCFHIAEDAEITSEANPGTLKDAWLDAAAENGINRISLGMQAAQPELLRILGRIHSFDEVQQAVTDIRRHGIRNINLDLMFGLPTQTLEQWDETLKKAIALSPTHLSCYGLIPEENTPLKNDLDCGKLRLPEDEEERLMYDHCLQLLSENGYHQYEISNFALEGYECRHNLGYWQQIPYLGIGASSTSMLYCSDEQNLYYRQTNPADIAGYISMVDNKSFSQLPREAISRKDAQFETLMLGLRTNQGISQEQFFAMHQISLKDTCFYPQLLSLEQRQLMAC
ncbi:MAG: radical SAM family heme chaperone HemW [Clostridia bacterium]|nr:radical SAM family heme chaperone HemW [Clostridia bacterium]